MPLTLSNREQNSGYLFYVRRLSAAVTRFSVRMRHDDRRQRAAVLASIAITVVLCLLMVLIRLFKPAGMVGESAIIANRDTGAVYVLVAGRLYPAFNLTSARLVTGSPATPKMVSAAEIAKYPTGPRVGIADAPPSEMSVTGGGVSAWAACDTAPSRRSGGGPASVTVIAGRLGGGAPALADGHAVLVSHAGSSFVVWGHQRSRVDLAERAVTVSLGLDPGVVAPVPISNALFDALPATEPIVVPVVPDAGAESPWPGLGGARVGSVIEVRDTGSGEAKFYAVLMKGLQPVSGLTAGLLRTANSYGDATMRVLGPDKIVSIPQVDVLNVGFYPKSALTFVDAEANPVTCVGWEKGRGDRQAQVVVHSGRGLPLPGSVKPIHLVRDDRDPSSVEATDAVVLADAANLAAVTSSAEASDTRESLWWISPQGVRYGISTEGQTLQALGVDPKLAVQAPWAIVRMFAQGPLLSKQNAMSLRDTVFGGQVGSLPRQPGS
ncbi:type VII secretion protein EccB (plasmid) [Mycobacterium paragordonae]|uniref:ESX-2 secretion system ATPase EccB2 n=1 Tax=Mycobacterium paragordonae TaxID=1389713 RepID=A0ABQ1CG57_9MYCO|nr:MULTISPECIES: type VII secretion protein EccB [Mycobacterium]AYE99558.1 type VII secretion protein EccB [Mycobacterium paragordonae]QNI15296.1 type VII secretion protein EccB [Mycobacterium kubicae]GFG83225.1 ESX-2 secretion system ATPase EccB2 [Mycobacterium paragordonae]